MRPSSAGLCCHPGQRNAATFGDHQRAYKSHPRRRRAVGLGRCAVRAQESKVRFADIHVSHLSSGGTGVPGTLGRACNSIAPGCSTRNACLSASVPALGRTRHPFAVSGSEEPSQKIEFVFSASPETIRREPRDGELLRSVGKMQDLAVCAFFILFLSAVAYAAAVLRSSAGVKSLCCRSTASRYATIFRATASVARFPFPFCFSLS